MKLHLPVKLYRSVLACFVAGITIAASFSYAAKPDEEEEQLMLLSTTYPNGSITYTEKLYKSSDQYTGEYTLKGYEEIMFKDIEYGKTSPSYSSYGGAISNSGTFTLSGNGAVTFRGNTVSSNYNSYGGAICNESTFTLSDNQAVTFSDNTASSSSSSSSYDSYGGAIFNSATFTMSGNGDVIFCGNTASSSSSSDSYGGAIFNSATFTLIGNGTVTFSGNTAFNTSFSHGGAICNSGSNATFTLIGNGTVTFSGNTTSSKRSSGGAIYNYGTFMLSENGTVIFSDNTASSSCQSDGGAIYNFDTFTLSDNQVVSFIGNTASITSTDASSSSGGGAIFNCSIHATFTLSGNGTVTFNGNTASSSSSSSDSYGGAIYNHGTFTLVENGTVSFSNNTAFSSSALSYSYGGAIYNFGIFTLSDNQAVTFSDNTASSSSSSFRSYGGAICNSGSNATVTLGRNGTVSFIGNTASSSSSSHGGAIYNSGTFTLSGNGDVTFIGNTASSSSSSDSYGGAIFNSATFTLSGNGDVLFEKNVEKSGRAYRLRSIYSTSTLNLAASAGKSITFRDSVYAAGTVNLNQDYTDAAGMVHKSMGDIILTGATTEEDLREVKGGVDGTASEILNSRTSKIATMVNLYGGRLIVEDKAILKGQGITAAADSSAMVRVKDGELNHSGYALTFNNSTTLEAEGVNAVTASTVAMKAGSTLSFVVGEANLTTAALTLTGTLTTETISVAIDGPDDLAAGTYTYALMQVRSYDTSAWTADKISVETSGISFDDLSWHDGTLYLNYVAGPTPSTITWSNASGNGLWNTSSLNWSQGGKNYAYSNGTDVNFGNDGAGTITLEGNLAPTSVTVNNGSGADYIFAGTGKLTGSMSLTKQGAGKLTINTANDYTGLTTVNSGTLTTTALVGDMMLNGGTLAIAAQTLGSGQTLTFNGGDFAGALTTGSGSLVLSANGGIDGVLTLNGGSITFNGHSLAVESTLTLNSVTALNVGALTAGSYMLISFNDVVGSTDNLTIVGTKLRHYFSTDDGELVLHLLGEGEQNIVFPNDGSGAIWGEGSFGYQDGDEVTFDNTGDITLSGNLAPGHITVTGVGSVSFVGSGSITGSTDLIKDGTGTLTMNDGNTYTGGTIINVGTVIAGGNMSFGTGNIALNGGTLDLNGHSIKNDIALNGGVLAAENGLSLRNGQSLLFNGGSVKGDITTTTGVKVTLEKDGTIDGALTLNGGTLALNDNALAVTGALNLLSETALDVSSYGIGEYKLLTFGALAGSLDNLNYDSTVGRNSYSVIKNGNALVLSVESHAVTLTWNAPKGVWTTGGSFGSGVFEEGDDVIFRTAAAVTITGAVEPGEMLVDSAAAVKFTAHAKTPGSGIIGKGMLTKNGVGLLTLNAGNTYSGGTVLNAGTIKATAADSFGAGDITVHGGTLDLGGKAVSNNVVLAGDATIKGDAKYTGTITVDGEATLLAKTTNKSVITIGAGNTLDLAPVASVAGGVNVAGGTLNIAAPKGLTIAKGMSLTLNGGTVKGLVNVGAGAVLDVTTGTLLTAPTLSGGTLTTGGKGTLTLSGSGSLMLGSQSVTLKSKGDIRTDEDITVTGGKVTLAGLSEYNGALAVDGGTLSLGKVAVAADVNVNSSAALNNGSLHSGNINVSGELIKGTAIKLTHEAQRVNLNHAGVMSGTISGLGIVNVNANIDASLGKLTNTSVNLNSGTLTNAKGLKLAKNQSLVFNGGNMNLAGNALTTAAGSALHVEKSATLSGALTLGGGALVLEDGANLSVSGALTLSKATTLTLDGTATLTFGALIAPKKGTLEEFFGVGSDVTIRRKGNTLTFSGYSAAACAAPETEEFEVVAAAAPEGDVLIITPETVGAPALAVSPAAELAKKAVAERPLGDALVMADWGIVDANRAFTGTLQSRRDSGVLLADGQGMAWVSAMGGVSRHGSENGHNGADVNLNGAAVGVEHTAGANSVLGLAVGHTWSRIGATGMQHLRQDTAHVALYGQTKLPHGFTAEWSAAYGDTDSKGSFYGTRETWSQKSTAISARLSKSHELNDNTAVRGFAGLSYDATDAASIHGMHTGSIQRLQGEVGAGITHRADKLTTYAEASVTTDLARNAPAVDFGTWRQGGATPGRTGLNLTLGAAYELTDKWSVNAAYRMEAAERATQHSFNVGAGMKF